MDNGKQKMYNSNYRSKGYSSYKIYYFYHITHRDNIENILKYGLLSHNFAYRSGYVNKDISDPDVNGNRASMFDKINNRPLYDYAPLYFNAYNPMLYKRKDMQPELCILGYNKSLITQENVIFTDGNAASSRTNYFQGFQNLQFLDWNCIRREFWKEYSNEFDDSKRIRCAEILVPEKIDLKWLQMIYVFSDNSKLVAESHLQNITGVRIKQIEPKY